MVALIDLCAPNGPSHDIGRAPVEEAIKTAVVLDQPSIGEAVKDHGSSDGLVGPSIQVLSPPEGVDLVEVSSDLFA